MCVVIDKIHIVVGLCESCRSTLREGGAVEYLVMIEG